MKQAQWFSGPIKEILIADYLKKHPKVDRERVMGRLMKGQSLCEAIDRTLDRLTLPQGNRETTELFQKRFAIQEDERYRDCQRSLRNCKYLLNFLCTSADTIPQAERNQILHQLRGDEKRVVDCAYSLHLIKDEFALMIEGTLIVNDEGARDALSRYFQAVLDQLAAQNEVYKRENQLGIRFANWAALFIRQYVNSVETDVNSSVQATLVKALELLKRVTVKTVVDTANKTFQELEFAVDGLQKEFEERKREIQEIEQVIQWMEKVIKHLQAAKATGDSSPASADQPKKKSNRMAFITRLFGDR